MPYNNKSLSHVHFPTENSNNTLFWLLKFKIINHYIIYLNFAFVCSVHTILICIHWFPFILSFH